MPYLGQRPEPLNRFWRRRAHRLAQPPCTPEGHGCSAQLVSPARRLSPLSTPPFPPQMSERRDSFGSAAGARMMGAAVNAATKGPPKPPPVARGGSAPSTPVPRESLPAEQSPGGYGGGCASRTPVTSAEPQRRRDRESRSPSRSPPPGLAPPPAPPVVNAPPLGDALHVGALLPQAPVGVGFNLHAAMMPDHNG